MLPLALMFPLLATAVFVVTTSSHIAISAALQRKETREQNPTVPPPPQQQQQTTWQVPKAVAPSAAAAIATSNGLLQPHVNLLHAFVDANGSSRGGGGGGSASAPRRLAPSTPTWALSAAAAAAYASMEVIPAVAVGDMGRDGRTAQDPFTWRGALWGHSQTGTAFRRNIRSMMEIGYGTLDACWRAVLARVGDRAALAAAMPVPLEVTTPHPAAAATALHPTGSTELLLIVGVSEDVSPVAYPDAFATTTTAPVTMAVAPAISNAAEAFSFTTVAARRGSKYGKIKSSVDSFDADAYGGQQQDYNVHTGWAHSAVAAADENAERNADEEGIVGVMAGDVGRDGHTSVPRGTMPVGCLEAGVAVASGNGGGDKDGDCFFIRVTEDGVQKREVKNEVDMYSETYDDYGVPAMLRNLRYLDDEGYLTFHVE